MTKSKLLAIALLALILGACAGNTIPDPEPADTTGAGSDGSGADTDGWDEDGLGDLEPLDGTGELAMIIYFGFDLSDIRAEDQAMLERHAINLANDSGASVRLKDMPMNAARANTILGLESAVRRPYVNCFLFRARPPARFPRSVLGKNGPQPSATMKNPTHRTVVWKSSTRTNRTLA